MRNLHLLNFIYAILCIYIIPYSTFILITSLAALCGRKTTRPGEGTKPEPSSSRQRLLVVVPAYDEGPSIAKTVLSCKALQYPASLFEVLVIADNCSDDTALQARQAGARVLERFDAKKKSKGHAIEYLIETLIQSGEFDSLDALVIIDADSTVHPALLGRFSQELERGSDWIQCYDCVGNADQSWRTRLMAYGFSLINGVTLLGLRALGLSAGLRGNGMCVSTEGLRRVPWTANGLAEDLEYSWSVRIAGGRIVFIRDVAVYATMLTKGGIASANQRRRWEFGRSVVRRKLLGPLLRSPHLDWIQKAAAVVELTMQPAIHLVFVYLVLSVLLVWRLPRMIDQGEYWLLAFVGTTHAIATLGFAIFAVSPLLLDFLAWRYALSLIYLPYYALWKVGVLLRGRPQSWTRTIREREPIASSRKVSE